MALKLPYRMRLLVSVGFFMVLCSSVVSYNSSDCMSFYRRDIMETWRIPQGSGLCNIKTNCSDFNVTSSDRSLEVSTQYGNTSVDTSFASYRHYSGKQWSVLLDFQRRTPYLIFETVQNSSYYYTCQSYGDDTGLDFSKYTLYIREGDIIVEGQGIGKFAYFVQFFTMVVFLVISVFKTNQFHIASIGYPVFLFCWIFFTGLWEINVGSLILGLVFIFSITYVSVRSASKKIQQNQSEISAILNAIVSVFMLVRCSYSSLAISVIACIYMLSTYFCLRPSASSAFQIPNAVLLVKKIKEGNLFMTTWLISLFFQLDAPLPLLLMKYQNLDRAYPTAPGMMILVGDILVGPIVCFCIGGFVFRYAREFKKEMLTPSNPAQPQGYFAAPEYPVYGQPPHAVVGYQNQPVFPPQQPTYIQNQQANPFM